jgi:hypothetical protein
MAIGAHLPGESWFRGFRNTAIRCGVYVGADLALVLVIWLFLANRVPFLDPFALGRNIAAGMVLCFLAAVPILRFWRMPGNLLASSLIAWAILSLAYRALCLFFRALGDWHSPFQVFMLGAVVYMIIATISWIGTVIWRAREAHGSHPNNHAS